MASPAFKEYQKRWVSSNRDKMARAQKRWRERHPEYLLQRRNEYEQGLVKKKQNPESNRLACQRWREKNKHKVRAHGIVKKAIARGILVRKPCEVCGEELVHAHHEDYSLPLSVKWLCPMHHGNVRRLPV